MIKLIFYFSLLLFFLASQIPIQKPIIEIIHFDKVQHLITFSYLSIVGLISYRKNSILLFIFFYGIIIEVFQHLLPFNRQLDLFDIIANTIGILLGFLFYIKIKFTP